MVKSDFNDASGGYEASPQNYAFSNFACHRTCSGLNVEICTHQLIDPIPVPKTTDEIVRVIETVLHPNFNFSLLPLARYRCLLKHLRLNLSLLVEIVSGTSIHQDVK